MLIKLNSLEKTAETQISRQKLPINQYTVFHQIITIQTLFINFFKMPIIVNSLEQTAETQISRQKLPINHYAVFHQITTNKTLL